MIDEFIESENPVSFSSAGTRTEDEFRRREMVENNQAKDMTTPGSINLLGTFIAAHFRKTK